MGREWWAWLGATQTNIEDGTQEEDRLKWTLGQVVSTEGEPNGQKICKLPGPSAGCGQKRRGQV